MDSPLPLLASAANLVIYDASAVFAFGPRFVATFLRITSSLMVFCLAVSAAILSVSDFASATASSTPEPRYYGVADSDAVAAGADDEEAAVDAAFAGGPNVCGGPFGDCSCCGALRCVCGSPRVVGRGVRVRFGPCADDGGTTGGYTNVCPWCGPG